MKDDPLTQKIYSHPAITTNFDYLQKTGIINIIEELKLEIKNLNEILKIGIEIFNKNSIQELVNYLTTIMLDKFVPTYLAFIIQEEFSPDKAYILCYNNLKPIESIIKIESIKPYKKFFELSPAAVSFKAFKHMVEDDSLIKPLLPLNPELLVPLMGIEGLYGFIVFSNKVIGENYTEEELSYINKIMKFSSVSLQNYIHYKRAIYDNKTKLYTFDYFFKRLEEHIEKIKRYGGVFSILMIDIDFFKKVNDTYGHTIGDFVLEKVSELVRNTVRCVDIVARYGGEEFIIILTECSKEKAYEVAERLRKRISEEKFYSGKENFNITISIGVTDFSKESILDPHSLIRKVDEALYTSKMTGRNKITVI